MWVINSSAQQNSQFVVALPSAFPFPSSLSLSFSFFTKLFLPYQQGIYRAVVPIETIFTSIKP